MLEAFTAFTLFSGNATRLWLFRENGLGGPFRSKYLPSYSVNKKVSELENCYYTHFIWLNVCYKVSIYCISIICIERLIVLCLTVTFFCEHSPKFTHLLRSTTFTLQITCTLVRGPHFTNTRYYSPTLLCAVVVGHEEHHSVSWWQTSALGISLHSCASLFSD